MRDKLRAASILEPPPAANNLENPIAIDVRRDNETLAISVINSGLGLHPESSNGAGRRGVGIANVKDRLRLHYGNSHAFTIEEMANRKVRAALSLPLQFSERPTRQLTGYGV